ncbi:alpha/beta hydrolase [Pseudomonas piscis]|uniref:alpha/beta hydrolase n=1 Tax=Pseudomonas piscis TaxID=2614538 RepID=UPI0003B6FF48|nr:alpha/beta hydrolase [Pseudomonas piscis]ERO65700.1 hypothetical protein P308_18250 [Pseudomonas piscis]
MSHTIETVQFRNPGMAWHIAADLHFPPQFDSDKQYPAIISAHPIGSCKEQTSGNVYGAALAKAGFVVIAFDASYQGASGGEPRLVEDPGQRVEDFRQVVDYLVTLPYVDADRIGVLGICGGGGYAISAIKSERRIRAVASITGVNFGRLSVRVLAATIQSLRWKPSRRSAPPRPGVAKGGWTMCCRHRWKRPSKSESTTSMFSKPPITTRLHGVVPSMAPPASCFRVVRRRWTGMPSTSPKCC